MRYNIKNTVWTFNLVFIPQAFTSVDRHMKLLCPVPVFMPSGALLHQTAPWRFYWPSGLARLISGPFLCALRVIWGVNNGVLHACVLRLSSRANHNQAPPPHCGLCCKECISHIKLVWNKDLSCKNLEWICSSDTVTRWWNPEMTSDFKCKAAEHLASRSRCNFRLLVFISSNISNRQR